jgi:hypothetical protein
LRTTALGTGTTLARVTYKVPPSVELNLVRLSDVRSVQVTRVGADDATDPDHRLRQTWMFEFAGGATRSYEFDARDQTRPTLIEELCRRITQHI